MKIIPERSAHWYHPDGRPCHKVEKASGDGMRDTTIRDARQLGLYPSVTSVLSVVAKPGLEAWKQEQAILAALSLPRLDNEPLDQYARRVVNDMGEQVDSAIQFGRDVHKAIENWLMNRDYVQPELEPYLAAFKSWAQTEIENVYATEKTVVNLDLGFAGTLDIHCRLRGIGDAVVDVKTQGIKPGKEPNFYPEWAMQLAAYARTVHVPGSAVPEIVSVVVNSTEPGPVFCHQWDDCSSHFSAFFDAFSLWCYLKNYYPQHQYNQSHVVSKIP